MSKKKLSKLLALYLPYVVIGLVATNLGEAPENPSAADPTGRKP